DGEKAIGESARLSPSKLHPRLHIDCAFWRMYLWPDHTAPTLLSGGDAVPCLQRRHCCQSARVGGRDRDADHWDTHSQNGQSLADWGRVFDLRHLRYLVRRGQSGHFAVVLYLGNHIKRIWFRDGLCAAFNHYG